MNTVLPRKWSLSLYPDRVLRTICDPVERFDSTLRDVADAMWELMWRHQGLGLAAPQVGLNQRLMVCEIRGRLLALANVEVKDPGDLRHSEEGCLSLPGVQVNVRRPERIRVTGYDLHGQRRSFGATGLWARVIQHEVDHLNGVLICDHQRPQAEQCSRCPLELPAMLHEERMHGSRPH